MMKKSNSTTIQAWLHDAAQQLANVGITSGLLDAEIILAHTLRKSRTYLHAHGNEHAGIRELDIANARLDLRLDRVPIAYIIGHKEFYSRLFKVTPATLIPRPESESIITILSGLISPVTKRLVDIGTGSGCLGVTAKLEFPQLDVLLTDTSRHALSVAASNATILHADVHTVQSDLFDTIPGKFDVVIANLPYVDKDWQYSPELAHEPQQALFAGDGGLETIKRLLRDAPTHLAKNASIILEADPRQHQAIIEYGVSLGYHHTNTDAFAIVLRLDA